MLRHPTQGCRYVLVYLDKLTQAGHLQAPWIPGPASRTAAGFQWYIDANGDLSGSDRSPECSSCDDEDASQEMETVQADFSFLDAKLADFHGVVSGCCSRPT